MLLFPPEPIWLLSEAKECNCDEDQLIHNLPQAVIGQVKEATLLNWTWKQEHVFFPPTMQKSSSKYNVEDDFISKYISETFSTEMWKLFAISYRGERMIEMWKDKKSIQLLSNSTEIFHKLKCGRLFHIRIHFWNVYNLSVEEICNILKGWKNY